MVGHLHHFKPLIVTMFALCALLSSCAAPAGEGAAATAPADTQPEAFQSKSIVFRAYRYLGDNISVDTVHSTDQYICGLVGMAALNGDIDEDDAGDIVQAYLYSGDNGNWWIRSDFHTHENNESRNIDVLCVKQVENVFRYEEYSDLGDNITYDTRIDAGAYICGVVGYAALGGDIDEDGVNSIVQAFMYPGDNDTWMIRSVFRPMNAI